MKKDNPLSVWRFPYRKQYYLSHPWKWLHCFYWNVRNFFHRGRYGFGYVDVWNWSNWWPNVGAQALRYLAEHGNSYPGCEPFDTPEKWRKHLMEMANKLDECAEMLEVDNRADRNEFHEAYEKMVRDRIKYEFGKDGLRTSTVSEMTEEDKELKKKYWNRWDEISKEDEQTRSEILAEIGKNLPKYWD